MLHGRRSGAFGCWRHIEPTVSVASTTRQSIASAVSFHLLNHVTERSFKRARRRLQRHGWIGARFHASRGTLRSRVPARPKDTKVSSTDRHFQFRLGFWGSVPSRKLRILDPNLQIWALFSDYGCIWHHIGNPLPTDKMTLSVLH